MPLEQQLISPSCQEPRSSPEAVVGAPGQDCPAAGECVMNEEISDFITRHVLEQDAQFFDG